MTYLPCAATEWDEAVIKDCVWASGLMLANKATLGALGCARAEREALARAAGLAEGHEAAAITDLERGMLARYGWSGTIYTGPWTGFVTNLAQGWGAVLLGYYHALPAHFTRWDPDFASAGIDSYHAVYIQRKSDGGYWWIDPLFHGVTGWTGESIPAAYAQAYATAYGSPVVSMLIKEGSHIPISGSSIIIEEPMPGLEVILPAPVAGTIDLREGVGAGSSDGDVILIATGAHYAVPQAVTNRAAVKGAQLAPPLAEVGYLVTLSGELAFIRGTAPGVAFTPTVAADPVSDCTVEIAAATATLQTELDAAKARATETAAELRRQATLLGG